MIGGVLFFSFVGSIYIFFFSPFFIIEYVNVQSSGGIDEGAVRSVVFQHMESKRLFFSQKRIFFFDRGIAETAIRKKFAIEQLVIKKKFPRSISIELYGRPFQLVMFSSGIFYEIAADGTISRPIDGRALEYIPSDLRTRIIQGDTTPSSIKKNSRTMDLEKDIRIPIVVYEHGYNAAPDTVFFDEKTISFLTSIQNLLHAIGVETFFLKMKKGSQDVRITTPDGWDGVFTLLEKKELQVSNLDKVLRSMTKKDKKKLQYVDVRFANRVYYKIR